MEVHGIPTMVGCQPERLVREGSRSAWRERSKTAQKRAGLEAKSGRAVGARCCVNCVAASRKRLESQWSAAIWSHPCNHDAFLAEIQFVRCWPHAIREDLPGFEQVSKRAGRTTIPHGHK